MKVGVIDYGVGNLGSVLRALEELRVAPVLVNRAADMHATDCLILPGVGNFADCARLLDEGGWATALRDEVGSPISVGISGDPYAAAGLLGGCDVWYSVLAGVLPAESLAITRAALSGEAELALSLSARLDPLWELFRAHGSYRVASAIAAQLGLVPTVNLPRPVHELDGAGQRAVAAALRAI